MSPYKECEGKPKPEHGKTVPEQSNNDHTTYHKIENMWVEVLEQFLVFLVYVRQFTEVLRLPVVSKTWRRVSLNTLKTSHQLNLSGFQVRSPLLTEL